MTRLSNILVLFAATLAVIVSAYSTPKPTQKSVAQTSQSTSVSRATFLTSTAAACGLTFLSSSTPALAKEIDPALKGTKADPEFQACLSQCIYECTKPKGMEQRSRAECLPECKSKCATTKAQLMKGEPKKEG